MQAQVSFDFSKTESQSLIVHSVRMIFLALVFLVTLAFQLIESRIISYEVFLPIYMLVGFSFFLQIGYFVFFRSLYQRTFLAASLFVIESLYITGLIYYIGVEQSLLIFLYLVNIILCGVLFQRRGALLLALLTSVLFSFILSLETSVQGHTAYLAIGVNNLAFFTVAYLSGYLSEQLNVMGVELKERTQAVKTLKNLNALILTNMNSGLMTTDDKGLVFQVNPLALRVLGVVEEEVLGKTFTSLFPGFDQSSKEGASFDYLLRKSGEKMSLRMHLASLVDEDNQTQGHILTFQDETKLRELERRVRQSEKLAAIGQLAAGIAHEIRNPLASISGSIQLLQADEGAGGDNPKLMSIVMKEISRLNNLITEFLDYAKPEAPMEDHVNLDQLLQEILDFTSLDQKNVPVKQVFEPKEGHIIKGNKDKLKQAFLNIIVNAYQAFTDQDNAELKVAVDKKGEEVVVSISDNGCGMDEKLRNQIFEPFRTTKSKGTGLGLAITHSIFESHKAKVQVDSQLGEGTTFTIQFQE